MFEDNFIENSKSFQYLNNNFIVNAVYEKRINICKANTNTF